LVLRGNQLRIQRGWVQTRENQAREFRRPSLGFQEEPAEESTPEEPGKDVQ
jgi:hypothetical protein